ncbi:unnamed protein product, partial [Iphiclides podalirius]
MPSPFEDRADIRADVIPTAVHLCIGSAAGALPQATQYFPPGGTSTRKHRAGRALIPRALSRGAPFHINLSYSHATPRRSVPSLKRAEAGASDAV